MTSTHPPAPAGAGLELEGGVDVNVVSTAGRGTRFEALGLPPTEVLDLDVDALGCASVLTPGGVRPRADALRDRARSPAAGSRCRPGGGPPCPRDGAQWQRHVGRCAPHQRRSARRLGDGDMGSYRSLEVYELDFSVRSQASYWVPGRMCAESPNARRMPAKLERSPWRLDARLFRRPSAREVSTEGLGSLRLQPIGEHQ